MHEKLRKEEKELTENFNIEITKTKEKLENYLSLTNNGIKMSEKINKINKKFVKEEYDKKSILKKLSLVSNINKFKKKMENLFNEQMKSLKFTFSEEERIIKYEKFSLNGFPLPESIILTNSKKKYEFVEKLLNWSGYKSMELLFRGTRDGMNCQNFHKKCDNNGQTITLIQNNLDNIFGGYASIPWTSHEGKYFSAPDSFIFTLTNIYNTEPTKFPNKNDGKEVCHNKNYGPLFGEDCDIYISSDFINGETKSTFPSSYQDVLGKGKSIFTGNTNNNNGNFKIKEIEVFKLFK